jgi:hypothetical protein
MSNKTLMSTGLPNYTVPVSAVYTTGTTQDPIIVPLGVGGIGVTLSFDAAGTASIEATNSPQTDIDADTAIWATWADGAVSATTQAIAQGITAVRVNRTSGSPRLTVSVFGG